MDDFEFVYEEEEVAQSKPCQSFEMSNFCIRNPALARDLKALFDTRVDFYCKIDVKNFDLIDVQILDEAKDSLFAHFSLQCNNKYPFEAPTMDYYGPRYDFLTSLRLTFDFRLTRHDQWSVQESIHSILMEIMHIIKNKKPLENQLIWTEEEKNFIDLLKEINYFKDLSHFEEYRNRATDYGKGTGYSIDSQATDCPSHLEMREKRNTSIFEACLHYFTSGIFSSSLSDSLDLPKKFCVFIEKSSYLYISKLRKILYGFRPVFNNDAYDDILSKKTNIASLDISESANIWLTEEGQGFVDSHYFCQEISTSSDTSRFRNLFQRILIDILDLETYTRDIQQNSLSMIRFIWSQEFPQLLKFIIIPDSEPYLGGMFEFHALFPDDYPSSPPRVHFMTTGGGAIRFNPNLYADGKVCLSLLGTWSGEQWCPSINNIVHVVQAIQVMIFTDQPVQNEPAYSSEKYFDHPDSPITPEILLVRRYKYDIKYFTLERAIIPPLTKESCEISTMYRAYFEQNKKRLEMSFQNILQDSQKNDFHQIADAKPFQSNSDSLFANYSNRLADLMTIFV